MSEKRLLLNVGGARLAELVALHQGDRPEPAHRTALLQRLSALHTITRVEVATAPVRVRVPWQTGRGVRWAALGMGSTVAAAAAAWVLWFQRITISPEPTRETGRSELAVPTRRPASANGAVEGQACVAARGDYPSLWDGGRDGLNAPTQDGRFGSWVHFRDDGQLGTREAVQVVNLDASVRALNVSGPATPGWGAKLGLGLRARPLPQDGVRLACYDASSYRGLRFRASGSGIVQVVLQGADSIPVQIGGRCTDRCWFSSSHAVALTATEQTFEIPWRQFGMPDAETAVVPQLMMLDFVVQSTDAPYSLTLRDVSFISRSE